MSPDRLSINYQKFVTIVREFLTYCSSKTVQTDTNQSFVNRSNITGLMCCKTVRENSIKHRLIDRQTDNTSIARPYPLMLYAALTFIHSFAQTVRKQQYQRTISIGQDSKATRDALITTRIN